MKRVTLDDLSARLSLSKFSVSRALSGKGGVSERTRQQVFDAARELGYDHPAMDKRDVQSGRRLLLVIPRADAVASQFWMEIIAGAEVEADRLGYNLTEHLIRDDDDTRPAPRGIRGLIVAGRRSRGLSERFLESGLPAILIGHPHPFERVDSVRSSSWGSGYLVGHHLAELGHRRVAYVTDVPEDRARQERLRGLRDAMPGAEVTSHHYEPGSDAIKMLRNEFRRGVLPTAVSGATDMVAVTMAWALSEIGFKIPQHVSIAGSNDSEVAIQIGLRLTTVRHPMRQVGAAAIQMLDWRLEHAAPDEAARQLLLQPAFVRRDSTARADSDALTAAAARLGFGRRESLLQESHAGG